MTSATSPRSVDRTLRFIAAAPRLGSSTAATAADWRAEVRRIEDSGFDILAVSEHYTGGWAMEPLTALAFAAAESERMSVVPLVLNNDLRHPAVLAKAIATADVLSGGRAMLGLGAGWLAADYEALGLTFDPAPVRLDRFEEALTIIRQFFNTSQVDHLGTHYTIRDLEALPAPTRPGGPPVLVGGGGPRLLRVAGTYADIVGIHITLGSGGFNADAARELTRDEVIRKIDIATRAAAQAGRERPSFQMTPAVVIIDGQRSTAHRPGFTDYISRHPEEFEDTPAVLIGDTARVANEIRRWQAELGIDLWHLGGDIDVAGKVISRASAS